MQLPFERQHCEKMTRHHLLFEKPQWEARPKSTAVRQMGTFVVGVVRAPHDYVHAALKPVPVPGIEVLKVMEDIGHSYQLWHDDEQRIEAVINELVGFANFTHSPRQCHEALEVVTSIEAQMAVIGLMRSIKR